MGLLSRFRRRRRDDDYVGRHRPGSWGELALPPIAPAVPEAELVAPDDLPITVAPAPAVVEPATVVAPAVAPAPAPPAVEFGRATVEVTSRQRVRLGFADGTSVDIEDASGASNELIRAAARIIDDPR